MVAGGMGIQAISVRGTTVTRDISILSYLRKLELARNGIIGPATPRRVALTSAATPTAYLRDFWCIPVIAAHLTQPRWQQIPRMW